MDNEKNINNVSSAENEENTVHTPDVPASDVPETPVENTDTQVSGTDAKTESVDQTQQDEAQESTESTEESIPEPEPESEQESSEPIHQVNHHLLNQQDKLKNDATRKAAEYSNSMNDCQNASEKNSDYGNYNYYKPRDNSCSSCNICDPGPSRSNNVWMLSISILCLLVSLIIMAYTTNSVSNKLHDMEEAISSSQTVMVENKDGTVEEKKILSAEEIYEQNIESIVSVETNMSMSSFFGTYEASATGTGFFASEDGYIMTNNHVVDNATDISVVTHDGNKYPATLVGVNADHDFALLKIDVSGVKAVKLGDSDAALVGETVYTIGHPLYMDFSMSYGIIGATNRVLINNYNSPMNLIQVTMPLNEGNSGGPVFNEYGEVIGIANAKFSGYTIEGMGFAVPINDAIDDASQLKEFGDVVDKAVLGITTTTVDETAAMSYHMTPGVFVYEISDGSPSTGILEVGDIITSLDGNKITDIYDLLASLMGHKPGDVVSIEVVRGGETINVQVALSSKREMAQKANETADADDTASTQDDLDVSDAFKNPELTVDDADNNNFSDSFKIDPKDDDLVYRPGEDDAEAKHLPADSDSDTEAKNLPFYSDKDIDFFKDSDTSNERI